MELPLLIALVSALFGLSLGFQRPHLNLRFSKRIRNVRLLSTVKSGGSQDDSTADDGKDPQNDKSAKCISGGGDMSDRFKYKVNALLGVYDPQSGVVDNEFQTGNILNAMVTFPTWYSFVVVGKTNGQEEFSSKFLGQVQAAVSSVSGPDHRRDWKITPRGKNFTKITVTALVESAEEVQSIYRALDALEMTIMRY